MNNANDRQTAVSGGAAPDSQCNGGTEDRGTFASVGEVLGYLGITEYADRIFNSNSRGELSHLVDYAAMAEFIQNCPEPGKAKVQFKERFEQCVKQAEREWGRPESVFQHLPRMFGA